jgi:hypothetical protein
MDAPAVLLPNGKVLCLGQPVTCGPSPGPVTFMEYDPGTNVVTAICGPANGGQVTASGRLLLLPTGQVLFSNFEPSSIQIEVYTPDGQPNAAWKPTIMDCPTVMLTSSQYLIRGTQFNGLSQACSYGDDAQMATNYPIVRLTYTAAQIVVFLRTFNHSTMGVATGNTIVSTNVQVPDFIVPTGQWDLVVIANGIASDPFPILIKPGNKQLEGCKQLEEELLSLQQWLDSGKVPVKEGAAVEARIQSLKLELKRSGCPGWT